jgi:hypothetical protein
MGKIAAGEQAPSALPLGSVGFGDADHYMYILGGGVFIKGDAIEIESPNTIKLIGDVEITGNLQVTGNLDVGGTITPYPV